MTRKDGGSAPHVGETGVVMPFPMPSPRYTAPSHDVPVVEAPLGKGPAALLLDITRSVKRVRHAHPTGIDRVERAHAAHFLSLSERGIRPLWLFATVNGRPYLIPPERARRVLEAIGALVPDDPSSAEVPRIDLPARLQPWRSRALRQGEAVIRRNARPGALAARLGLPRFEGATAPSQAMLSALPQGAAYLNVGHDGLHRPLLEALARAGIARFVLMHDAIPLTHPEYSAPEAARRFRVRLDAAFMADGLIANSQTTAESLAAIAGASGRSLPPTTVAPLGVAPFDVDPPPNAAAEGQISRRERRGDVAPDTPPRFVMLGTIEGRKNHLLMLALWRGLSDVAPGTPVPELHIVGRRGWAAGQVFEMLDRAPMMGWSVFEHADLDDGSIAAMLQGARALLFPSFVEGYGLPVAEALGAGVPVIASDLPSLREVAGDVPEWLDPLDGPGWLAAIRDYATPYSRRRAAQLERLQAWRPPVWSAHFSEVERALSAAG
ncbi:MAG: glycosyltransferase family 1 protein [Pseudomonadota bacterium]